MKQTIGTGSSIALDRVARDANAPHGPLVDGFGHGCLLLCVLDAETASEVPNIARRQQP